MTPNMRETFAWLRKEGFMKQEFTLAEKTAISRAYDAGNYGNAYEGTDLESALKRARYTAPHTRAAFVLGFFSSYSLDEIGSDRETFDECYFSAAGQYVVATGYCDSRDEEYADEESECAS
jgi:hypothetical protein